ncbi:MAG: hypothetical protein WC582_04145 [Patescibacteria group bacterium]
MFDDLNQKNNKIEDIFSGTEAPVKPDVLRPKEPISSPPAEIFPNQAMPAREKQGMKKILIFVIMIIAVIIIIFGIFWILKKIDSSLNETPKTVENQETGQNQVPENATDNSVVPPVLPAPELTAKDLFFPPEAPVVLDSDQDGLTDEEENILGTDINNIDTDSDGLFDREETKVYKTNPLLVDTDGDGYSDGDEVKNGYNPTGAGRLYEISN